MVAPRVGGSQFPAGAGAGVSPVAAPPSTRGGVNGAVAGAGMQAFRPQDALINDAAAALENLGYKSASVHAALDRVRADLPDGPLEAWLRQALKIVSP